MRNVVLTVGSRDPADIGDVRVSTANMVQRLLDSESYAEMPEEARPVISLFELDGEVFLNYSVAGASLRVDILLEAEELAGLYISFAHSEHGYTGEYDPRYDDGKEGWFYYPDQAGLATLTVIVCNEMGVIATRTLEFTIHEGPPPDDDEDEDDEE